MCPLRGQSLKSRLAVQARVIRACLSKFLIVAAFLACSAVGVWAGISADPSANTAHSIHYSLYIDLVVKFFTGVGVVVSGVGWIIARVARRDRAALRQGWALFVLLLLGSIMGRYAGERFMWSSL